MALKVSFQDLIFPTIKILGIGREKEVELLVFLCRKCVALKETVLEKCNNCTVICPTALWLGQHNMKMIVALHCFVFRERVDS